MPERCDSLGLIEAGGKNKARQLRRARRKEKMICRHYWSDNLTHSNSAILTDHTLSPQSTRNIAAMEPSIENQAPLLLACRMSECQGWHGTGTGLLKAISTNDLKDTST